MIRDQMLTQLQQTPEWDVVIIGGGATGLGCALDAASRGFKTLLIEQSDFAKGTSSRSTKLVHGGVRYLAQGNLKLVYDALHERGLLLKNAPHLVRRQAFIIPCFSWFSKLKYLAGLKFYDLLSGRYSFGKSSFLSRNEVAGRLPELKSQELVGGVEYFDGQFYDAKLGLNIAQTCVENNGTVLNYFRVLKLQKEKGKLTGVVAQDIESRKEYQFRGKVVINATGVFVDDILQMDEPEKSALVRPSQGVHIVLGKSFLHGNSALMIPE